jgi:hypothetical protein
VPLIIGITFALAVGIFATIVRLDRDRAFYPTIMIVIALLYSLFAAIGGSTTALLVDGLIGLVFIAATVWGFRTSLWIVAAALAAHGLMDIVHERLVHNPGVPTWWPSFCMAYDVVAAGYLAWLIRRGHIPARA